MLRNYAAPMMPQAFSVSLNTYICKAEVLGPSSAWIAECARLLPDKFSQEKGSEPRKAHLEDDSHDEADHL